MGEIVIRRPGEGFIQRKSLRSETNHRVAGIWVGIEVGSSDSKRATKGEMTLPEASTWQTLRIVFSLYVKAAVTKAFVI